MGLFTGSTVVDILGITTALVVILIAYFKWTFQYFKKRNVPHIEPSFPFGNLQNPLVKIAPIGVQLAEFYKTVKAKGLNICGVYVFASPQYMLLDFEDIKNILTKNFDHFDDRGFYVNEKDDPIGAHLFAIGGTKWKNLRAKLTPTFTPGKLKIMFQGVVDCGKNLEEVMEERVLKNQPEDFKEIFACFTTDVVGSCAFGLDCNTFKDANSPFRKYLKKMLNQTKSRVAKQTITFTFPSIGRALGLRHVPKDISDFFTDLVVDTVKYREEHQVDRKDFLQLLIDLKNGVQGDGSKLTMNEVVAQSFLFFLAGFETSSTTMTFALFEMACNPDVQDKVREEIEMVLAKHNNQLTYESIHEMKYMDQVLDETLRKYPPFAFVTRVCTMEYKIPDKDIIIEKGSKVIIPILGIQMDEEYYPNPEKFDPERFNEENKKNRPPYAHIPFGAGPRACLGLKFGLMQSKIGLMCLLKNLKFSLNKKTQLPLKMSTKSFIMTPEGGMWLDFEKI